MQIVSMKRAALLALLVAGLACARNSGTNDTGAAAVSDTLRAPASDSASGNQTESGVTDSTGESTLGPRIEQTRPDQGQPVTSKGDTISTGIDSSSTPQ